MSLRTILSNYGFALQRELFPTLEEELGPLGERYELFVTVLGFVPVEPFLTCWRGLPGRPQADRAALARAFSAKTVFAISTTRALIERLVIDGPLRRLCGWSQGAAVPSEATFSRAFSDFADSALPSRLHEALIDKTLRDHLVGHVSRDSTAILGREKPAPKSHQAATPKRRRGRPRKGEQRLDKAPRRLARQSNMILPEMLADLPCTCDVGVKRDAKGHQESWSGYKLHIDAADGGVPLSCILTSASLHDSQAAIPLATLTATRVTNLYDPGSGPGQALMDSACDAPEIRAHSESLGHVALIDVNPRNAARKLELKTETQAQRAAGHVYPEHLRYRERTTVERVNGRLKDEFGARQIRVRGHAKVLCHLLHALLAGESRDSVVRTPHRTPNRLWILASLQHRSRPGGVSGAETLPNRCFFNVCRSLLTATGFCKWLMSEQVMNLWQRLALAWWRLWLSPDAFDARIHCAVCKAPGSKPTPLGACFCVAARAHERERLDGERLASCVHCRRGIPNTPDGIPAAEGGVCVECDEGEYLCRGYEDTGQPKPSAAGYTCPACVEV